MPRVVAGSRGHAWLWLALSRGAGICWHASQGRGRVLAEPLPWHARCAPYREVRAVELPEEHGPAVELVAARYNGWGYGAPSRVAPPVHPAGSGLVRTPHEDAPPLTVCSVATAGVLLGTYTTIPWTPDDVADLVLRDGARPWSPIAAAVRRLGAVEVPRERWGGDKWRPMPEAMLRGAWFLCQGWDGLDTSDDPRAGRP